MWFLVGIMCCIPIHVVSALVAVRSVLPSSNCGTKMAEYASDMPTTRWKDAEMAVAIICGFFKFL